MVTAAKQDPRTEWRHERARPTSNLSYPHLALLVVSCLSVVLIVVGIALDGSSPLFLVLPLWLVYVAIHGLRR